MMSKINRTYLLIYLLTLLSFFLPIPGYTQWYCEGVVTDTTITAKQYIYNDCSQTSNAFLNKYQLPENYIPYNDTLPIITIKINFNIWQKVDSTGNYPETIETYQYFQRTEDIINDHYLGLNSLPTKPLYGMLPHVNDTRIRVESEVFFYRVEALYGSADANNLLNYIRVNYPERMKGININVVRQVGYGAGFANHSIYNDDIDLYIVTRNSQAVAEYPPSGAWGFAPHIAHELGHNLGLFHTYYSYGQDCCHEGHPSRQPYLVPGHPDFLRDVFELVGDNTWPCVDPNNGICYHNGGGWESCDATDPLSGCTNNLMGGHKDCKFKSPLQIGRMRRELSLKTIRKYAYGYNSIPYVISNDETWDFSIKFYQDVVVESGATLTVQCEVQMVPEAKIVVKPGGKLIIDGGRIGTDYFNKAPWKGIYVEGDQTLLQTFANQGAVILQNGAIIENAVSAINLHAYGETWWTNGGIVQANDAVFRNNKRDVAFTA